MSGTDDALAAIDALIAEHRRWAVADRRAACGFWAEDRLAPRIASIFGAKLASPWAWPPPRVAIVVRPVGLGRLRVGWRWEMSVRGRLIESGRAWTRRRAVLAAADAEHAWRVRQPKSIFPINVT